MKKIFVVLLINLIFNNIAIAESYYFKNCKLNEIISADYLIDLESKIINVILKKSNEKNQKFFDEIKLVEKDRIVTKKIKSSKSKNSYFIYYLDVKSQSVIKQNYQRSKVGEINLVKPVGEQEVNYCSDVKSDWEEVNKKKIIKKTIEEENKKKEKRRKELEEAKIKSEKKRKAMKNKHKVSVINNKWVKISKYSNDNDLNKKLIKDFDEKAKEICLLKNKNAFDILSRKIGIVETDETPAFGLEAVIKIGISGIIECK
tara:strand:- start:320 stop:1096 length:777 start_codon:yes stop_codon:yes gene_type:complete